MLVSLSRLLVFAEPDDARDLVAVLAAIAGTAPPPWAPYTRDGSEVEASTVTVAGTVIEVAVGERAAPSLIELRTDRPLTVVLDEVVELIGSASTAPSDPDAAIEAVTAHVGEVTMKVTAEVSLVTQLTAVLADAEAREDPAGVAWARHSLAHATKVGNQMQAVEDLLLALIPTRERGALSALAIAEAMPRITDAVDAAVAEAEAVSAEIFREDQAHRAGPEADHG